MDGLCSMTLAINSKPTPNERGSMKRSVGVILVVGLGGTLSLAAVSGCGNGVKPTGTARLSAAAMPTAPMPPEVLAKAKQPVWRPSPARPGEIVYPGLGIRYTPANEQAAAVTSAQARAVADSAPYASTAIGEPDVQLARVTDDDIAPGSGTAAGHSENALAWVFKYKSNLAGAVPDGRCDLVIIVDATNAAILDGFQRCPPP